MPDEILNRTWLPHNACFGCGHENEHGLRIEVRLDDGDERLTGTFVPPGHASGFPGLTHGGALFSAMDCLATWVMVVFGPRIGRYWLLGSASVDFRKASRIGEPVTLQGRLVSAEPEAGRALVRTEGWDAGGRLLVEAEYTEVAVPPEQFRHIARIPEIPAEWRALFERTEGSRRPAVDSRAT